MVESAIARKVSAKVAKRLAGTAACSTSPDGSRLPEGASRRALVSAPPAYASRGAVRARPDRFPDPEPSPEQFTPHVSTAYVNSESPVDPLAAALTGVHSTAVTATFGKASLLVFHRDHCMYQWTDATPIPIGTAAAE